MADDEKTTIDNNGLFNNSFDNVLGGDNKKANYEKQSLKLILSLIECSTSLKNNKIRISRLMVERLDLFIEQLNRLNTCSTNELKVKQDIREIQTNIANYVIKSDKGEIRKLKQNLKKLNTDNKQLILSAQKKTDLRVEDHNKLNKIVASNQEKLRGIVKSTMNNEVAKFFDDLKPVNLEKLDFQYRMLLEVIDSGNNKEISVRREKLIHYLKLNRAGLKKNYKYVKVIDDINALLNKPSPIDEKQSKIKQLLAKKENKEFENYFGDSVDNYLDFKKRFRNLYDYLDVKRLKLYNGALEDELQKQRETLKYRYSEEVITAKIGPIDTYKLGWPIVSKLYKNTMTEIVESKTFRKKWDRIKQSFKDVGRIIGLPFVSLYKLIIKIIQEGIIGFILSIIFFFSKFAKRKRKKNKKERKKEKKEAKKKRKEDEKKIKEELNKSNDVILNKKKELVKDYNISEGLRADFNEVLSDVNNNADKEQIRMEEKKKENAETFSQAFDSIAVSAGNKSMELPSGKAVLEDSFGIDRTLTRDDVSYSYKCDEDTVRCSIIDKNNNQVIAIEQGSDGKISKVKFTILEDGELKQVSELEDVTENYMFDNVSIGEDVELPCLADKEGNYIAGSIEKEYIDMLSKSINESVAKK